MTNTAALAAEYLELKAQAATIDDRIKEIVHELRGLGEGPHEADGITVTVGTQPHRFNPALAATVLASNPELLAQCQETVISSAKAKRVLAPAVYLACSEPSGDPRVNVR